MIRLAARAALLFAMPVLAMPVLVSAASAQPLPPLSYVQPLSPAAVRQVQERLRQLGAYGGNADGIWGRDSQSALERFQSTHGLQVTGQLNQATAATLGVNQSELLATEVPSPPLSGSALSRDVVRNIQGRLGALGFYSGQVDGLWGPGMQTALERFQQGRGLQPTGQLNPATITAMGLDPNNLSASPVR
jgi:peptidoglycan hydrolase-like protein with peptidoglycan-binding domain